MPLSADHPHSHSDLKLESVLRQFSITKGCLPMNHYSFKVGPVGHGFMIHYQGLPPRSDALWNSTAVCPNQVDMLTISSLPNRLKSMASFTQLPQPTQLFNAW
jgi:hypothetical protein